MSDQGLSYADAGVDIAAADGFVERIARLAGATLGPEVVQHESRYAGLFRLNLEGNSDPLLAVTCDGVGTKLLVAKEVGQYRGLGQDLVAMSVNDLLPLGAKPLVFLDYLATGKLDPKVLEEVVAGIAGACRQTGCALIGGETAEMPGLYPEGDFDLAGFAVGIADGTKLPRPDTLVAGDMLLGLPSNGVHSNGLSLARKALFDVGGLSVESRVDGLERSVGEVLLDPTALYAKEVAALWKVTSPKVSAHITGGGFLGRCKKMARPGLRLRFEAKGWDVPRIFQLIAEKGGVTGQEMACTFNMGLGFVTAVDAEAAEALVNDGPWLRVGNVVEGDEGVEWGNVAL